MSRKHRKIKHQIQLEHTTRTEPQPIIAMNINTADCVVHENKIFIKKEEDGFRGFYQVQIPIEKPSLSWIGGKIPWSLWSEVCAFFEWGFKTYSGENQVRLFYNHETMEWKAWAFPQKASGGMTTVEIGDHPDRNKQDEEIGQGFRLYGSIHHHCKMNAFQSGTDHANETPQNGIHVTIGNISEGKYSTHFRVVMAKTNIDADLTQWFSVPAEWATTPFKFHDDLIKHLLHSPPSENYPFPEIWKTNVIKEAPISHHSEWSMGVHEYEGGGLGLNCHKRSFQSRDLIENQVIDEIMESANRNDLDEDRVVVLLKDIAHSQSNKNGTPFTPIQTTPAEDLFCVDVIRLVKTNELMFWRTATMFESAMNQAFWFAKK